ncbi:MAG: hypothetical protein R2695_01135 [Acidimicrobiales bacterium]
MTTLGIGNEFYLSSTPVVTVVLCATFVSWMGTSVAPHYVAVTSSPRSSPAWSATTRTPSTG